VDTAYDVKIFRIPRKTMSRSIRKNGNPFLLFFFFSRKFYENSFGNKETFGAIDYVDCVDYLDYGTDIEISS
jgi:hypothetical protein